jgi:hypothetical protein
MADQLSLRGGTTSEHASFTGANKEVTVDTTKKTLVVHDGATPGGHPIMRENGSNSALLLGSAATPALKFSGDTNTGIYSPGPDQVAVATNGTGRLFVDASGNVGVGLSPSYRLDVAGPFRFRSQGYLYDTAGTSQLIRFTEIGTRDARMDAFNGTDFNGTLRYAGANLLFETGTGAGVTERLRITSAGLVGIGTSAPQDNLHIAGGNIRLDNNRSINYANNAGTVEGVLTVSSGNNVVLATPTLGGSFQFVVRSSSGVHQFLSGGTERVRIDSSGRVGIGTASPGSYWASGDNLVIADSGDCGLTLAGGTTNPCTIAFADGTTGDQAYRGYIQYSHNSDTLAFGVTGTEAFRVDSSKRLLVGTSSARTNVNGYQPLFQVETASASDASNRYVSFTYGRPGAGGFALAFNRHAASTVGGQTVVAQDYALGIIEFNGSDGTNFISGATIGAFVDGTPGTNDMPGRLVFSTTADGSASPTEALRITNDRVVAYNQAAPAAVNATATLTVANLKTGIITSTSAAATDMTLPTGTDTEGGFSGLYTNFTFEWSVINTGPSLVQVLAATAHTIVGSGSVATGTSGRFASRRTAANTFVTYRLS